MERIPDGAGWCRGVELGLRQDVSERPASIADLRAAMGIAARGVDVAPATAPGGGDGRSVFISYAHNDATIVETLVRARRTCM
jgi:hypothetical protein